MALVVIQSRPLTREQKQRIGERVLAALHQEGLSACSTVLLFQREEKDILLDGLLVEAQTPEPQVAARQGAMDSDHVPRFKTRTRRTKSELRELKQQLLQALQAHGSLTSLRARCELGIEECDWAAASIRRLFHELEEEGHIVQQGLKRGTRYALKGLLSQGAESFPPILAKPAEQGGFLPTSSNF